MITLLLIIAYGCIKLSILFFYRRTFVVGELTPAFNVATWLLIVIVTAWTITFLFVFIFSCGLHFSAMWGSRADLIQYCSNGLLHEEGLYISEFLTNVLLLLAPIPSVIPPFLKNERELSLVQQIFRLRLETSRKFQVLGVVLLAFT